ncbi:Aste57867_1171 [Aphanomyces stellatus]|uniref:Aste57867_1171 protein n=1 Tax=Aphanomyces stellatus TaxID=120398 RepID=A0A485KA02_9STRA|nr:hypothetical protein As57867_001170 [Aphanomyces stellatus]VFT78391.1 Aste57867_1171 [Aphanomyces stellatus]
MAKASKRACKAPVDDDVKLKKRAYIRHMMRMYRHEAKEELAELTAVVPVLESQLERLHSRKRRRRLIPSPPLDDEVDSNTILSWKDMALALRDDNHTMAADARFLHTRIDNLKSIFHRMQIWVAVQESIPRAPPAAASTWRNVTLFGDPSTRFFGKTWIVEQLYHNSDRMFQHHGFPAIADGIIESIDVEVVDNAAHCVLCRQFDETLSRAAICALYRTHLCAMLMVDGLRAVRRTNVHTEVAGNTILHRMTTHHGETIHLLAGEFHDEDRSVFVAQQVLDDQAMGPAARQRHRTWWTELIRVPSSDRWKRRILYTFSQSFTADGTFVPLEVEAADWGMEVDVDASDEAKARQFREATQRQKAILYAQSDARLMGYVQTTEMSEEGR